MRITKTIVAAAAAVAMAIGAFAPMANAEVEVSASAGVANMYYWRGLDLGNGDAAVSGDIAISAGGAYGGVWSSSGDAASGTEFDLYAGYGHSFGDFSVDLSTWTYAYPETGGEVGDLSEAVLSLGYGPFSATYIDNIAGDSGYWYSSVGATFDAFSVTLGLHEDDYSHLDLGYAYNDNLSFIVGLVVDDVDGAYNDQPKVVVSYTLPIE